MKNFLYRLTGGRPMDCLELGFRDCVVGKPVWYWRDKFGRRWMAFSAWSFFRVRVSHD